MFRHLFTSEYMFAPSFVGLHSISDKLFLALALILLAIAIFFVVTIKNIKNPIQKNLYSRWQNLGFTISILVLIWIFLRYEGIAQISDHWIVLVIYLIGLIWAGSIIRYVLNQYKPKMDAYKGEQLKKKYM
ncbi:MAG: hypothetical protein JWO40_226 [Candidatus Doudnabacteria bacterium]|nr:hypothetical protein [Candidatus Doudnabacteria bacterium]